MKTILEYAALLVVVAAGVYFGMSGHKLGNAVTQGIVPHVGSDSSVAVGPQQALTVASAASNCVSRTISTASTSLMLSFSASLTPTATVGHYQAASTTVSYDNAQFGCGAIKAWASASSTVTAASVVQ